MAKLSVIIPVYNVEAYLDDCLESVESQTFSDIEIVCVNDGSTDASLDKLESWAMRDARIRIVDKPNGGLSSARNAGIRAATSDYVCFLDSDDRFYPNACEEICKLLDETNADVLTFGANFVPVEKGDIWLKNILSPRDAVYEGFSMGIITEESSRPFAWRMALRRTFLLDNNLFFDEGVLFGEDQVFCFAVYPRAAKTVLSSKKLYEYRVWREGSLMDRMNADLHAKSIEHVNIVNHILADWDSMGMLHPYASEMVSWTLDFVTCRLMEVDQREFLDVSTHLSDSIRRYFTLQDIQAVKSDADKRFALDLLHHRKSLLFPRKYAAKDFFINRYGISNTARWLLTDWHCWE